MKKNSIISQLFCLFLIQVMHAQTLVVDSLFYTGATQTFVIPQCASNLSVMLHGAQGGFDPGVPSSPGNPGRTGGWPGGDGGRIYVVISPTPGVMLYVNVGGGGQIITGGWNGGGNGGWGSKSPGGGGGGATDIRVGGNALSNRVFVAGGGGGGGGGSGVGTLNANPTSAFGGNGGGLACNSLSNTPVPSCPPTLGCGGENGNMNPNSGASCSGVTLTGTGAPGGGGGITSGGGGATFSTGCSGTSGTLLQGGNGGDSTCSNSYLVKGRFGGGGGGGGFYGGGGGHSSGDNNYSSPLNGGGGGGSTFLNSSFVLTYSLYGWAGVNKPSNALNVNNGVVTFSYYVNGPGVNVSASQNTICSGSSVVLSANGVNSYTWLPTGNFNGATNASVSVNPVGTTEYTVKGLNSTNCISQTVVSIYVKAAAPAISLVPAFSAICPGGSITLSASGASLYNWSNGQTSPTIVVSPSLTTVYSITASSSATHLACTSSGNVKVLVYPAPVLTVSATRTLICRNEQLTVSAGGALTYTWHSSGGTSTVNSGSMILSPTSNITYSVTGASASGCEAKESVSIQVDACTGLDDVSPLFSTVIPNPTHSKFYLELVADAEIAIYSLTGEKVVTKRLVAGEKTEFHISSPGVYILQYQSGKYVGNLRLIVAD